MRLPDALETLSGLAEDRLRDPAASLRGAQAILAEVQATAVAGDGDQRGGLLEVEAKAWTVVGLAHHALGELASAVADYRRAIEISVTAGLKSAEALARASLAPSLVSSGDAARAEKEIEHALTLATPANRGLLAFYQALVLQRTGRLREAMAVYDDAMTWLEEVGDQTTLALTYSNRGVMLAYHGDLEEALESLAQAERIERQRDLRVLLAMDTHNTGFTLQRLGRLPDALAAFDRAEDAYAALGNADRSVAVLQADRCEAFLLAGMVTEALPAATSAVEALAKIGDLAHLMECRILLAQALLAGGDYRGASSQAALAARGFTDASRAPWAALAHYVEIQADIFDAQEGATPPHASLLDRCRQIAAELQAEGWPVESVHVRTFAGRVALALGQPDVARAELALAAPARRRGTADLRARAWLAMALLRLADGDRGGAKRALGRGMSVVDRHLGSLGATELRVNAASHGADLARVGTRLAVEDGRAADVLRWAERWRSRAMARPPVRPPDDDRLAADLAELRRVRAQLREVALRGPSSDRGRSGDRSQHRTGLVARASQLEDSVRRQNLRVNDGDGLRTGRIDLRALRAALGDRLLVEFVSSEGGLYAVTVTGTRTRLHRLGSGSIEEEKRYLLFALRRLLASPGRPGAAASLAATAARLDSMLLTPLRIPPDVPVVIVPTGSLHGLPWPALPTLTGRSATIAPSAAIWLAGARPGPPPQAAPGAPPEPPPQAAPGARPGPPPHAAPGAPPGPASPAPPARAPVALIAGPDLPDALDEVTQLAQLYDQATCLVGPDATTPAVLSALGTAALAHLAAHGTFRADSPMFSSVLLADGPLTVYDLERLRRTPDTVVVAACDAAVSAVRTGDGLLGTAAALIGLGVRSVVAPVMPVPDFSAAPIMVALHRRLIAGDTPAQALASSRTGMDPAVGAAFICIGCDDRPAL